MFYKEKKDLSMDTARTRNWETGSSRGRRSNGKVGGGQREEGTRGKVRAGEDKPNFAQRLIFFLCGNTADNVEKAKWSLPTLPAMLCIHF